MSANSKVQPDCSSQRIPAYVTTLSFHRAIGGDDSGHDIQLGSFLNPNIARLAARRRGGWGGDGRVETVNMAVVVYCDPATGREVMREVGSDVRIELVDSDPRVKQALSKLDPGDIEALMRTMFK